MKILVFGGDGFCGWPTSLHLSARGHEVHVIDDQSRRTIDQAMGTSSALPISELSTRLATWRDLSGKDIPFTQFRLGSDFHYLVELLNREQPDAVVHFAEQRSAPYSMKSGSLRNSTVSGNVDATHHLLNALAHCSPDTHLVHLGTMGVYGYGGDPQWSIPEGYISAQPEGDPARTKDILFPTDPGSIYHMTKSLDQVMFQFYCKNDELSITDLHQGVVWGTQTEETSSDDRLRNRFDYCGDYGTVLNRFILQSLIGHPLTVHGTGGQTRAFINIQDTVRCIELALLNPPTKGQRVQIRNQATEVHRVRDLADMVSRRLGGSIASQSNPRKEKAENDLPLTPSSFLHLGLNPIYLDSEHLDAIASELAPYAERIDSTPIVATSSWAADCVDAI